MKLEIEVRNIKKSYGKKKVLNSVSFKVEKGKVVGIFGPSGCGKTTFLEIISGLKRPDGGKVYLRGKKVNGKNVFVPPEKRRVGFIFQDLALWPHMSVKEHLDFVSSDEKTKRKILKLLGLDKLKDRKPDELSGGEKQKLAIARCLAQGSDILLMDEPFSSLDIKSKKKIIETFLELRKKFNLTILYVSHEILEIVKFCDKVLILENGKITASVRPRDLFKKVKKIIQL